MSAAGQKTRTSAYPQKTVVTMRLLMSSVALALSAAVPLSYAADATVGNGQPASCTETTLAAAINTVQADSQGGTVRFNCGGAIGGRTINLSTQKLLTGVITIDGGGNITLNAQSNSRIFQIDPRPNPEDFTVVNLQNLVLINGFAAGGFGGAILGNSGVQLNLSNVTINNSRAGLTGGAIAMAPGSTLNVSGSSFRENTGTDGGAIATSAITQIVDSRFVLNTATGVGTTGQGGAIQSYSENLAIETSIFSFNLAVNGGAIYKRDAFFTMYTSQLANNTAADDGGALFAQAGVTDVRIGDSRFIGNIATNGAGGAIRSNQLDVDRSLFDNNRAQRGGAVSVRPGAIERALIVDCTLSNNFAQSNGGAGEILSTEAGTFFGYQLTTSDNVASTGSGGDFYFSGDVQAKFQRSSLLNASAPIANGGGSIRSVGSNIIKLGGSLIFSRQGQDCTGSGFTSEGANVGAGSCNLTHPGSAGLSAPDQIVLTFAQLGLAEFGNYGGQFNNYLPEATSPALNTFRCNTGDLDARRLPRNIGSNCDSGALERQLSERPAALFRNGFEGEF